MVLNGYGCWKMKLDVELIIKDEKLNSAFYEKYLKERLIRENEFSPKELVEKAVKTLELARYLRNKLQEMPPTIKEATEETIPEKLYYATYFAVQALLATKGLESKKHIALLCALAHNFPELKEEAIKIMKLKSFRESVTYGLKDTPRFESWFSFVEDFVSRVIEITRAI